MRHAEPVARALGYLTPRMRELAACDVFCGDPVFAGLHRYGRTSGGGSYRTVAHCCHPLGVGDRRTTVVLPDPVVVAVVLHELGHAVHFEVEARLGRPVALAPVTAYARTDRYEAFAEAFLAWHYPADRLADWWPGAAYEREGRELLDRLAVGGW